MENNFFVVYCPDFSQWPYEYWIAPKVENTYFGDLKDEELKDLVVVFKDMLLRLKRIFKKHELSDIPFAYNFYIYPNQNWYIRVIPRFVFRAGFELGTGLSVNIVDPVDAAEAFREEERKEKVERIMRRLKSF
jgi:UDPglucose--hexose-1-phosphate uridylyltransferase